MSCSTSSGKPITSLENNGSVPASYPGKSLDNPFFKSGAIHDDAMFVLTQDMQEIIAQLQRRQPFVNNTCLVGESGAGKSSFFAYLSRNCRNLFPGKTCVFVDALKCFSSDDLFYEVLQSLGGQPAANQPRAINKAVSDLTQPFILFIDEIEKVHQYPNGQAVLDYLRSLCSTPNVRLCVGSHTPLEQLNPSSDNAVSPFYNVFTTHSIGKYPPVECRLLIGNYLVNSAVQFSSNEIDQLVAESGGSLAKLQRAAAALFDAKKNSIA